ncbi:MAG: hypothetical protein WCL30_02525, partial [Pseudomonadota bacterium]
MRKSSFAAPVALSAGLCVATNQATPAFYSNDNLVYNDARKNDYTIYKNQISNITNTISDYFISRNYEGWDGYDAVPISILSRNVALQVVNSFYDIINNIIKPEIFPTQVGGFSIEWKKNDRVFAIDIENKELSWSFIDFDDKRKRSGY